MYKFFILLKGRTSSIFNVPCRQAVYLKDYKSANEENKTKDKRGIKMQMVYGEIDGVDKKIHNKLINRQINFRRYETHD